MCPTLSSIYSAVALWNIFLTACVYMKAPAWCIPLKGINILSITTDNIPLNIPHFFSFSFDKWYGRSLWLYFWLLCNEVLPKLFICTNIVILTLKYDRYIRMRAPWLVHLYCSLHPHHHHHDQSSTHLVFWQFSKPKT